MPFPPVTRLVRFKLVTPPSSYPTTLQAKPEISPALSSGTDDVERVVRIRNPCLRRIQTGISGADYEQMTSLVEKTNLSKAMKFPVSDLTFTFVDCKKVSRNDICGLADFIARHRHSLKRVYLCTQGSSAENADASILEPFFEAIKKTKIEKFGVHFNESGFCRSDVMKLLAKTVRELPQLRNFGLSVASNWLTPKDFNTVMHSLTQTHIETLHLDIQCSRGIGREDLYRELSRLQDLASLKRLAINAKSNRIVDDFLVERLLGMLMRMQKLETLSLQIENTRCTFKSITLAADFARNCENLGILLFTACCEGTEGKDMTAAQKIMASAGKFRDDLANDGPAKKRLRILSRFRTTDKSINLWDRDAG